MYMIMLMIFFHGIVDRRKALDLISKRDSCQRFSPSQTLNTLRVGLK